MTDRWPIAPSLFVAFALVALGGPPARADILCANPPISLPGVSGPPRWQPGPASLCTGTSPCTAVDDPRWAAGPLIPIYSPSGTHQTAFRAIRRDDALYVSVRCELGQAACASGSDVFVAWKVGGAAPTVVRLRVNLPASTPANAAGNDSLEQPTWMSAVGGGDVCQCQLGPSGTCLENPNAGGALELSCAPSATVPWEPNQPPAVWKTQNGWAMHLAFTGLVRDATKFAVGAKVPLSAAITATWPACSGACYEDVIPKDPAAWSDLNTSCPNVVTISPFQVGVIPPPALLDPNTCTAAGGYGTQVKKNMNNRLVACPEPADPATMTRKATFRMANWGSVAGPGSWIALADASNDMANNRLITSLWPAPASVPVDHQCMLVEMGPGAFGSTSGPGAVHFAPAAVYRNMMFTNLSQYAQTAHIDLDAEDVKRLTGGAPDAQVFLYLQKKNMPGASAAPITLPLTQMDALRRNAETGALPKIPENVLRGAAGGEVQANRSVFRLVSAEMSVENVWPTFKIHPFLHTGRKTATGGGARELVVPLPPFGLYLRHEGPFFGFRAQASTKLGMLTQSGGLVMTERRPTAESPIFEVPVAVETMDDVAPPVDPRGMDGGAAPDAGASADGGALDQTAGETTAPCPPRRGCSVAIGDATSGGAPISTAALALLVAVVASRSRRRLRPRR